MKTHSTFFNENIVSLLRNNLKTNKAAAKTAAEFIDKTSYWMNLSYDELKSLMFSPTLKRSWFVRSDGRCPSCGNSIPMYNWQFDAQVYPWKMKCPHCSELFPKNDFKAFYDSGLDDNGVFRHENADRSLLVNEDGTDFGIDDGNGWLDENGIRYMFIGAWLTHAQWRNNIMKAIPILSFAYVLSGDREYARRSAVLLDAIARFFPDFDFYEQGLMYEHPHHSQGYVSYWAGSCTETRSLALAYDQIFEVFRVDAKLEKILGRPGRETCEIIEARILRDVLANFPKINSNPPHGKITVTVIKAVLDYNDNKEEVLSNIDDIIIKATMVDGLSGEKGLAGYATMTPMAIAVMLCLFSNIDNSFLEKTFERHPILYQTYRFHIDTWYNAKYYPGIGDNSIFALPIDTYVSLFPRRFHPPVLYFRSREWFVMQLYEHFSDPDFAKALYISKDQDINGIFDNDLYISNPSEWENRLLRIIDNNGTAMKQKSINYSQWRLSILHTGRNENKSMLAMPYDTGANHCHHEALSLHFFAKGHNIMPDFGYPPVNYGGWQTKEVAWYRHPAAHNMVVVDGKVHTNIPAHGEGKFYRYPEHGKNLIFAYGSFVKATYNDAKEYADAARYERLTALIDINDDDCYVIDISRTDGGKKHAKFQRSTYSTISTSGLSMEPGSGYYPEKTIMRDFQTDKNPKLSWSVDFKAYADDAKTPLERDLHLKYTGLTPDVSVNICESWVDITRMVQTSNIRTGSNSVWIPTVYEMKEGPRTKFTGILEPYEDYTKIKSITRPDAILPGDFDEAIEVIHTTGIKDLIIANNPETGGKIIIKEYGIETDALLAVVRMKNEQLISVAVCSGNYIIISGKKHTFETASEFIEFL